jgi:hypothetical protein
MTLFIVAAGVGLSSGVTHFGLGVRRPRSVERLLFALMMLVLCPFQLIVARFHVATSASEIVMLGRRGVVAAIILITLWAAFIRRYTGTRIHPAISWGYLAVSAGWLVLDLIAPWGLLFASSPGFTPARPGELPTILPVSTNPIGLAWQAFNLLTVAWTVIAGIQLLRRGRRRRGLVLVLGGSLVLATVGIDFARDALAETWPYLGGLGFVGLSLLLSAELASEYRENEQRLAQMVGAAIRLRDQLNTPLQTLRFGLETTPVLTTDDRGRITRLQRTVTKLIELGRDLQEQPLSRQRQ